MFFALPGLHVDGYEFIGEAVSRGAVAVVCERLPDLVNADVVYLRVKNVRVAMSAIAAAFYNYPSQSMAVIGVTGTEGKSTTVSLIFQMLKMLGRKAGYVSTVSYSTDGKEYPNPVHETTPQAPTLQRYLAAMRDAGAEFAVIEASSHGLSERTARLADVAFDAAVMTNVTYEHMEFHGTWRQYRDDKANLFRALDRVSHTKTICGKTVVVPHFGVVNECDDSAAYFADATNAPIFRYGKSAPSADLSIYEQFSDSLGNQYYIFNREAKENYITGDSLVGSYNTLNILAAMLAVEHITGAPCRHLADMTKRLKPIRGRMNRIDEGQPFDVYVDYAHTPSSFQAILPPVRAEVDERGSNLIVLFGSAGERDKEKRPMQGDIASRYADIIILTDEDPRGEDGSAILEDIAKGITDRTRGKDLLLIPDRPTAVLVALSRASPNDIVLLLGKGHENSIIYTGAGKKTIPYDEIAIAREALKRIREAEEDKDMIAESLAIAAREAGDL
jgi:UDP-N-acetylmuramoyl-L-alanyl-D-glutamate--2,6-diaminopimelate ligase